MLNSDDWTTAINSIPMVRMDMGEALLEIHRKVNSLAPIICRIECCPSVYFNLLARFHYSQGPSMASRLIAISVKTRLDIPWGAYIMWMSDGSGTMIYRDYRRITCVPDETPRVEGPGHSV